MPRRSWGSASGPLGHPGRRGREPLLRTQAGCIPHRRSLVTHAISLAFECFESGTYFLLPAIPVMTVALYVCLDVFTVGECPAQFRLGGMFQCPRNSTQFLRASHKRYPTANPLKL